MTRDDFTYGGAVGGGAGGGRGADTESAHNFDTYDHNYTSMQVCLQSIHTNVMACNSSSFLEVFLVPNLIFFCDVLL